MMIFLSRAARHLSAMGRIALAAGMVLLIGGTSPSSAADPFRIADYTFQAPESWESITGGSAMRKAQFVVRNKAGGDDGLVIFFHFGPGRGGSPEANIRRWQSQFVEPIAELGAEAKRTDVGGRVLHEFRATGTLAAGQGRRIPNYTLHAAVLESPAGNVFIRFAGPKELVASEQNRFRGMIENAMRNRQQ